MNLRDYIDFNYYVLENGLKVLMIDRKFFNSVSLNLSYKVGSRHEVPGKTGMAHLFEHLMFEGSKNLPKGDFDRYCTLAGGTNNAYTTFDMTAYTMTLPSNQIELGLWLESDRMLEFSVSDKSLETQKKVVIEEIRQTVYDQPYGRWRELLGTNAYSPQSPYSWEVHGTIEDVESVVLDDLREFFYNHYTPDNSCLTICGNFNHKSTMSLVKKYFSNINPSISSFNKIPFSTFDKLGGKIDSYSDAVPLNAVFRAFHLPGFLDDKIYIADIIANIAGGGRSSKLFTDLVENKQIASSIGAYVDRREETSLLIFYAIANNEQISVDQLDIALISNIMSFKESLISEYDVNKTINQLTTQAAYEIQFSSGLADIASSQVLFWNDPSRIYNLLDFYKKISENDLLRFSNEFLDDSKSLRIDVLAAS